MSSGERGRPACPSRRLAATLGEREQESPVSLLPWPAKVREGEAPSPGRRGDRSPEEAAPRLTPNELKLEALIVVAAVEGAATGETGGGAAQWPGAGEITTAMRTSVKIAAFLAMNRERQIVATGFAFDPKIGAGAAPFGSVRRYPTTAGAGLRQKVRHLVAQGTIDFGFAVRPETTIEEDTPVAVLGAPRGGAQSRGPFDADFRGERGRTVLEQEGAGNRFQRRVAAGRFFGNGRSEGKFELAKRKHVRPGGPRPAIFAAARCDR